MLCGMQTIYGSFFLGMLQMEIGAGGERVFPGGTKGTAAR